MNNEINDYSQWLVESRDIGLGYTEIKPSDNVFEYIINFSTLVFIDEKYDAKVFFEYIDFVSNLNVDDFAYAITCLYETYERKKSHFLKNKRSTLL